MMENHADSVTSPSWLKVILLGRRPKYTFVRLAVLILGSAIVFPYILLPIRVKGLSMEPAYREGGINLVNRLAYARHEPRRGDVVAIKYTGVRVMLMKRVVALPGEIIEFRRGTIYINEVPLDEPYVKLPCDWNIAPHRVGPEKYFVVGDNRSMDPEGHKFGEAAKESIVGKVLL